MTNRSKSKTRAAAAQAPAQRQRQRWRDYETSAGFRPVKSFLATLTEQQAAAVVAGMKEVAQLGLQSARHLRGEIYEVRVALGRRRFRVLFAQVAKYILLALSGFAKATNKAPPAEIKVAEDRLADWRDRGKKRRTRQ